jgi:hypothetical protein
MTDHKTGTRQEWLAARLELLEAEKELTRRSDELARRRRELPWVPFLAPADPGVSCCFTEGRLWQCAACARYARCAW